MRGCMTGDFIWIRRSLYSKFFITENKKMDAVDYIGSSEGCISHFASLNFNANYFYEDLHSCEKYRNTRCYEWRPKKMTAVSRYSRNKLYLEDKHFRMKFNIFKTALSSYFTVYFNPSMIEKMYPSMIGRRCRAFLGGFLALVSAFLIGI